MGLKEIYEKEFVYGAIYTGGSINWSRDGKYMFCQKGETISIVALDKGSIIYSLGEENQSEDTINCFTINHDDTHILAHYRSSLFKLWDWKEKKIVKMWKSIHNGPVTKIVFLNNTNLMASGGSDSKVRLWDLQHHACKKNLEGVQGVVSVLEFHPNTEKGLLFGAGDDTKIHGWNINTGQEDILLSGHSSKVTSISFDQSGTFLISSGRDGIIILWEISCQKAMLKLPVFGEVEGAFVVPNILFSDRSDPFKMFPDYVVSAELSGTVTLWEFMKRKKMAVKNVGLNIRHILYNEAVNSFAIVSMDHNIILYCMNTFEPIKQIAGFMDEILDIAYIGNQDSHIALASNSADIKLYELNSMNCQLLSGHTDMVLSLGTTPANRELLISSSKDNSVRVWLLNENKKMTCITSAIRHTASVGCIAMSQLSGKYFASVSQDSCLKVWSLPTNLSPENNEISVIHTQLAHKKDINSVTISPNDKFIATGSQDKTAKLWLADSLELITTFYGHRRGIWCVRFSPVDQVLLTTSADCMIKIWSLSDYTCLKSLQGHESSVLKCEFLSDGMQLITTGADGLLKLWSIKTSECICTLDKHEDRVWALAVSRNEKNIISGGSDSLLVIWKDVTEEKKAQISEQKEKLLLEEQRLSNLLQENKLSDALKIALELERPLQVLKIVEGIMKKERQKLEITINELTSSNKEDLLQCAIKWNTNSKNAEVAQTVINILTNEEDVNSLSMSSLESMIPYTDRHFKRLTGLEQDLHIINYTINRMKPHVSHHVE